MYGGETREKRNSNAGAGYIHARDRSLVAAAYQVMFAHLEKAVAADLSAAISKIRNIERKWCARQDSNLWPPD